MNPMPLEYRILTALLLGDATLSELALRIGSGYREVEYRVDDLVKHRAARRCGFGLKPRRGGRTPFRIELTPSGKEWALEMIGGVE